MTQHTEGTAGTADPVFALQITEADVACNEFRVLGGAAWPTRAERDAAFDAIPAASGAEGAAFSWVVDVLAEDEFSIVDDREVDEPTVLALFGEESILTVRQRAIEQAPLPGAHR